MGLYVAEHEYTNYPIYAGTCFTKFDYEYFMLFKKIKTLYNSLHADIQHDYRERLQGVLTLLKTHSRHLDYVYDLPEKL